MNREERESQENILRISHVISNAYQLGKAHKTDEAYETLRPCLERDEVPTFFCEPAGWTIYRYVKEKLSTLLPTQAKDIFGYYLRFCAHKPNMVHSYMLLLAMTYKKLHMQEFPFTDFCRAWDLTCFRDEDYVATKGTSADGKPVVFQSLAVRAATLLYKELKGTQSPQLATEFLPFFATVLQRCPDYEFTPLYIANLHAWKGDKDTSIRMFKKMLVDDQQWYVWKHLGDLMEENIRLSCYCKALTLMDKEEYIGEIHLALASMLINSHPEQAAYELQAYVDTYQRNGWRIKAVAYELRKQLGSAVPSHDGKAFYGQHATAAEDFVYGDCFEAELVFNGIKPNAKGKPRACLSNHKKHLFARVPPTPLLKKAKEGDRFDCRYIAAKGHVVLLTINATGKHIDIPGSHPTKNHAPIPANHPTTKPAANEERTVEGKVRIKDGQPFAFLDRYYISPRLRQSCGLVDGQFVKAVAVQQQDGRWRVTKILPT